ncbi:MAG: Mut7-C RNAse domain-containing protein [Hydrogenobacter sp.]|uniref:Mut7-C RNAse domain-containing protein n=1 Tax=Hydrogenobacter thermophilus TaxID=940 RepID=UPI0030FD1286
MKFLLESDLEKLAKWLRFLGQDVQVLKGAINKKDIVSHANRIFVTTSRKWERHFISWGISYIIIPKDDWEVQLCLIVKHFRIKPKLLLNRCPYCNTELKKVNKDRIKDKLPLIVYEFGYDFTQCPKCASIFWKGTHFIRMKSMLKDALKRC